MKTTKLTSEQLETMSYADVANLILTEAGHMMNIQEYWIYTTIVGSLNTN